MAKPQDNLNPSKVGERLAKVIARAGLASRREAEAWIVAGRVTVNGVPVATPACNVTAADRITVDGEPLPARERTRLFLYHKPRGLVTTHADPQGRPTIFAALPKSLPRLISIGRLDFNSEGLMLLTNDGGLARLLERPETGWLRRYRARAHGRVTQADLDGLRDGVTVDGMRYGPIEAALDRVQGDNVWLTIGIREGKNREVRNVLGHLGLRVNRLIRVSFGPFQLGELGEGEVSEVRTRMLREQLGERLARRAGVDFSGPLVEREAPAPKPEPRVEARPRQGAERPRAAATKTRQGAERPRAAATKTRQGAERSRAATKTGQGAERPRAAPKVGQGAERPRAAAQGKRKRALTPSTATNPKAKRARHRMEERLGGPELARRERKHSKRRRYHGKRET